MIFLLISKVESSTRNKTKPAATAAAGAPVVGTSNGSGAPKKTIKTAGHAVIASSNLSDVETQSPTSLLGSKRGISLAQERGRDTTGGATPTGLSESPAGYLASHETAIYCSELCYYPSAKANFPILKQVDVQISYGSLVAVMGPSGSGKVCLIMCRTKHLLTHREQSSSLSHFQFPDDISGLCFGPS
jgi:ABC-type multidrug transport system fused ATPase/permease subunit